jgi:hypothetical protein
MTCKGFLHMRGAVSGCRNALRKRCVWLGIGAAVLAAGALPGAAGIAPGGLAAQTLSWSYASFQAERLGGKVTADVRIATLSVAAEQAAFIPSPKGEPFRVSGPDVVKLSIQIRIDMIGMRSLWLENHAWLDPRDGTPIYLIRTRAGLEDYYQQFRFTREGVFRRQREPGSAAEAASPPESWSKLGEHFYAYPKGERCHPVLETSTLLYLLAAAPAKMIQDLSPLCVFNKRQLHRVSLQTAPVAVVGFDYLEKNGETETRRSGSAEARRIRIQSRPIGSYRGEVEDFFRGDTQVGLSLEGGLPLTGSCDLPLIGRVEMKLKEIRLK